MKHDPIHTVVFRGDDTESVHLTVALLVGPDGSVVFSAGDFGRLVPARSSIKPFQAAVLHLSGAMERFGLTGEQLALACASHSGEPYHVEVVSRFMEQVGVSESDLGCGSHHPYHEPSRDALLKSGATATALHNNCSGKHTGFLAAALAVDADLKDYLDPAHPVQQMIARQLQAWLGRGDFTTAIDGCSAPTFYLTIKELARLGQLLISGTDSLLEPQLRAMQAYPQLVGGTGRFDSDFMTTLGSRAVSKEGAEGVQLIGIRDSRDQSWGLALKVQDGASRPKWQVALAILESAGLVTSGELERLPEYHRPILRNHMGLEIGRLSTLLPAG